MDLNITWFILLTILFIGYVVLDGFDLGVGMNHLSNKNNKDRRISINSIGPVWDANEVWLITAGGALFAAFPHVYATVFSGFYIAFMLFLVVIIGRAISIEFRSKVDSEKWKKTWDFVFTISSYLITILLGVALGNIVLGIPVDIHREYAGTFWTLLNPYSIFIGIVAVLILKQHGGLYLLNKIEGNMLETQHQKIKRIWIYSTIAFLILFFWTFFGKTELLTNYQNHGALFVLPFIPIIFQIIIILFIKNRKYYKGFLLSSISIAIMIIQSAISIFPNLVPSSINPHYSLSVYNSSSSELTLWTMFIITCIGIPLILIYKVIVYSAFKGKVKLDSSSY